jgi:hypothetical protein
MGLVYDFIMATEKNFNLELFMVGSIPHLLCDPKSTHKNGTCMKIKIFFKGRIFAFISDAISQIIQQTPDIRT